MPLATLHYQFLVAGGHKIARKVFDFAFERCRNRRMNDVNELGQVIRPGFGQEENVESESVTNTQHKSLVVPFRSDGVVDGIGLHDGGSTRRRR